MKEDTSKNNQAQQKEIGFQGLYFHGVLEGFEPTIAGSGTDDKGNSISWGASLKLNFSTIENIEKKVGDTVLKSVAKRNFKVSIDSKNEELPILMKEWEQKLNKYQDIKLMPVKDGLYKLSL